MYDGSQYTHKLVWAVLLVLKYALPMPLHLHLGCGTRRHEAVGSRACIGCLSADYHYALPKPSK
jgi:hypothetical protein